MSEHLKIPESQVIQALTMYNRANELEEFKSYCKPNIAGLYKAEDVLSWLGIEGE